MRVTRLSEAPAYDAPNHHGWSALLLQGLDADDRRDFGVVLSYFLPGGGATKEASAMEKVYVVLEGEICVTTGNGEAVLGPLDSCHVAAGEERTVANRTNGLAAMMVIMHDPEGRPR